jgi:hypothetical protein
MATSYSDRLKIKLIGTGLEAGTWGSSTNENWKRVDQSISGYSTVTLGTTPTAPSTYNSNTLQWLLPDTADAGEAGAEQRSHYIKFTGSVAANQTVNIKDGSGTENQKRIYIVENALTPSSGSSLYTLTLKSGSGASVVLQNGATAMIVAQGGAVDNALDGGAKGLQITGLNLADSDNDTSKIYLKDAVANALEVIEAPLNGDPVSSYLKFVTTNSSEAVEIGQKLAIKDAEIDVSNQATTIAIRNSTDEALNFSEGTNSYLEFDTSGKKLVIGEENSDLETLQIDTATIDISVQATDIKLDDDDGAALNIKEDTNSYLKFVTTNGSEAVEVGQKLSIKDADVDTTTQAVAVALNTGSTTAIDFKDSSDSLLSIDTTNNKVVIPTVDIGGGEIDGAVIGANSAAAGTFALITGSDVLVTGADGYIYFNATSDDIGIRNASGKIQVKSTGAGWGNVQTDSMNSGDGYYFSQTWDYGSADTGSVNHLLGGVPSRMEVYIKCTGNDSATGWAANDFGPYETFVYGNTIDRIVYANASQVLFDRSNAVGFPQFRKKDGTGASSPSSYGNFDLIVKVWK